MSTSARAVTPPAREAGVPVSPGPLVPRSWAASPGGRGGSRSRSPSSWRRCSRARPASWSRWAPRHRAPASRRQGPGRDVVRPERQARAQRRGADSSRWPWALRRVLARTRRDLANAAIGGMALLGLVRASRIRRRRWSSRRSRRGSRRWSASRRSAGCWAGRSAVSFSRGARAATPTAIDPVGRRRPGVRWRAGRARHRRRRLGACCGNGRPSRSLRPKR